MRVNGVGPGAILPPPGADPDALARHAERRVPLGRAGDAHAVATSVLHLLRQDFATGAVIQLDGGEHL